MGYYTAKYNGITIDFPKVGFKTAFDYGQSGLTPVKIIETVTITGIVKKSTDINNLSVSGGDLEFSIGNRVELRNSGDDIEGGPKPDLTINRQVGPAYIEVTLVVGIMRRAPAGVRSGYYGVVELDVNYSHSVDKRGLTTWTTSGMLITQIGVCADRFREKVINDFANGPGSGDGLTPKGDFVREVQTFNFENEKTKMSFSVKDTEVWHKPAKPDVHFAEFNMMATTDGVMITKKVDITVQPLKKPGGIARAKQFAQSALHEMLFNGVTASPIFKGGEASLNSTTGEIKVSASLEVGAEKDIMTEPTAAGVISHIWWGVTTKAGLKGFVSGKRPGYPRGYSGRSACKAFKPIRNRVRQVRPERVVYKFKRTRWEPATKTGKVAIKGRTGVKAVTVTTDTFTMGFEFQMPVPVSTIGKLAKLKSALKKGRASIKKSILDLYPEIVWKETPDIELRTGKGGASVIYFWGDSSEFSDPNGPALEAALMRLKDNLEKMLNKELPVKFGQ